MALGGQIATWFKGKWHDGNVAVLGAADHAMWLGTQVFDGARKFEGVMPDLFLNCQRIIRSAEVMGMVSPVTAEDVHEIIRDGVKRFSSDAALYLRPMMWSVEGRPGIIDLDPESTGFAVCIEELPMPELGHFSLTVSPYCRPRHDMALTEAKAASLYANNGRIMAEARARGFSNALSLDLLGNVAETASTNVFLVKDEVVFTPVPNGTFLNGLNRQRVIKVLRQNGMEVVEASLKVADFRVADEIFATGNIAKVMPVARFDEKVFAATPVALKIREMYMDFAHSEGSEFGK